MLQKYVFCFSILHIIMKHTGSSRRITSIFDIFRIGIVTDRLPRRNAKSTVYSVYSNVRRLCALLCPAFSCPAILCPANWSVNFTSVIFTSCIFSAPVRDG